MDHSKRSFLKRGVALIGAVGLPASRVRLAKAAEPPEVPPWMKVPGAGMSPYGVPAKYEDNVTRTLIRSQPGTTGSGASRTPLEALDGMITPSGLHFERHHNGVPDIDPSQHRLLIHGMVRRPLIFTVDALLRYPMVSRIHFLECSGNSQLLYQPTPPNLTAGQTHGLVSCSEWTGVPLRLLLEEAGADASAQWILAEGGDAAGMSRSIPIAKAMDDAMLALFQNGERLRPENGYPVRLFLPGWEGNMTVKWLRRLELHEQPPDCWYHYNFYYYGSSPDDPDKELITTIGVKSIVTYPRDDQTTLPRGLHSLRGRAWSGGGAITRVEVSVDGGETWHATHLEEPRERWMWVRWSFPWEAQPGRYHFMSRATDEVGRVQPRQPRYNNMRKNFNAIVGYDIAVE